ncbi:HAMP domain-containing protein [Enterovibrio sp. Hal110]
MRSDSYLAESTHSVMSSFANPESGNIKTVATHNALAGLSAYEVVFDYRNIPVLSAYTSISFGDTSWALIAEIDESEAFGTIIALKWLLGFILLSGVVIITVIATVFTRSVTRPIIELTKNLETVAVSGDFSARVEVKSRDEIGQSADAFNSFMQSTQQALSEINKVMAGLAKGDFSNRIEADFQGIYCQ